MNRKMILLQIRLKTTKDPIFSILPIPVVEGGDLDLLGNTV